MYHYKIYMIIRVHSILWEHVGAWSRNDDGRRDSIIDMKSLKLLMGVSSISLGRL